MVHKTTNLPSPLAEFIFLVVFTIVFCAIFFYMGMRIYTLRADLTAAQKLLGEDEICLAKVFVTHPKNRELMRWHERDNDRNCNQIKGNIITNKKED